MARKRMIDPSFWLDEKLGECTIPERYLFMGLVSNADDEGYGRANPKLLKSSIFPYDDDLRVSDLEKWLSKLGGLNLVVLYTVSEQAYYYLPNFLKYQSINKPTESIYPKPDKSLLDNYRIATVSLPPNRIEQKRREKKRIEKNIADFFETVWKLYPRKEGKGQVSNTQKEKLFEIGIEEITKCVDRYVKSKIGVEMRFLKQGSTFFNSGYVDYLDANYEKPPDILSKSAQKELEFQQQIERTQMKLKAEGVVFDEG
jgi:hypothetical protein